MAKCIRTSYPDVNRLIATGKSIFVKARHRVNLFQAMYPEIPLPLSPVLTRWGSWLKAVEYYNKFYDEFLSVINSLDSDESSSVNECKELLQSVEIKVNLCYITSKFVPIVDAIEHLETRGLCIGNVISKINAITENLKDNYDKKYYEKLSGILFKIKGYRIIENVNSILCGSSTERSNEMLQQFSINDLNRLEYAPLVSCEVERVFSQYKSILADNRRRFNFENLKYCLIVKCNEPSWD